MAQYLLCIRPYNEKSLKKMKNNKFLNNYFPLHISVTFVKYSLALDASIIGVSI
jgi:hypothetical protein